MFPEKSTKFRVLQLRKNGRLKSKIQNCCKKMVARCPNIIVLYNDNMFETHSTTAGTRVGSVPKTRNTVEKKKC